VKKRSCITFRVKATMGKIRKQTPRNLWIWETQDKVVVCLQFQLKKAPEKCRKREVLHHPTLVKRVIRPQLLQEMEKAKEKVFQVNGCNPEISSLVMEKVGEKEILGKDGKGKNMAKEEAKVAVDEEKEEARRHAVGIKRGLKACLLMVGPDTQAKEKEAKGEACPQWEVAVMVVIHVGKKAEMGTTNFSIAGIIVCQRDGVKLCHPRVEMIESHLPHQPHILHKVLYLRTLLPRRFRVKPKFEAVETIWEQVSQMTVSP
jgi:hypothetical protein